MYIYIVNIRDTAIKTGQEVRWQAVAVVDETTSTGPAKTAGRMGKTHRRSSSVPILLAVDALAATVAAGGVYLLFHRWFVPAALVPLWLFPLASQRAYGPDADEECFRRDVP